MSDDESSATSTALWLWATDVHLDHVREEGAARTFGEDLRRRHPEAARLLVTGDIAEAPTVTSILWELANAFEGPVDFVLGNHDYYHGSFSEVDAMVEATATRHRHLNWMTRGSHTVDGVTLVGVEGWYDAGYGNRDSTLQLTDFTRIWDLFVAQDESRDRLLRTCAGKAQQLAVLLEQQLQTAPTEEILVLTHVPPFQAAAWHRGQPSNDEWAPFFSCRATGQVLTEFCRSHPNRRVTVLCGHTHGAGTHRPLDNLVVHTGAARYGFPALAGSVEVSKSGIRVKPSPPANPPGQA